MQHECQATAAAGLEQEFDDYADFVVQLIEAVRERKHIYDKKHVAYFNRIEREKAWREISEVLGQSVDECQKRWKLLREKLFKELLKRDRILANGEEFHSDWACFERMNFIEHHITVRKKHERFAPLYCFGITPSGEDQPPDRQKVELKCETATSVKQRRYRQRKISYKRLYSTSGQSSSCVLTDEADTSNGSDIKAEPTNLLEIEQHFDETSEDNAAETEKESTKNLLEQPTLRVRDFATSDSSERRVPVADSDMIFGQLVTAMLKDIPSEVFRDDAKLQVLQLLVHAKRNAMKLTDHKPS